MNFVYIKQFSDINGYELPSYKKIGISKDIEQRRKQLSGTLAPIFVETVCAWEFPDDNAKAVEGALHGLLSSKRTSGEWFIDEDNSIVDAVTSLMDAFSVRLVTETPESEKESVSKRDSNLSVLMEDYILKVKAECKLDFAYKCNKTEITILSQPNTFYLQIKKTKDPRLVVVGGMFKSNFESIKSGMGRSESGIRSIGSKDEYGYWDEVTPVECASVIERLLT